MNDISKGNKRNKRMSFSFTRFLTLITLVIPGTLFSAAEKESLQYLDNFSHILAPLALSVQCTSKPVAVPGPDFPKNKYDIDHFDYSGEGTGKKNFSFKASKFVYEGSGVQKRPFLKMWTTQLENGEFIITALQCICSSYRLPFGHSDEKVKAGEFGGCRMLQDGAELCKDCLPSSRSAIAILLDWACSDRTFFRWGVRANRFKVYNGFIDMPDGQPFYEALGFPRPRSYVDKSISLPAGSGNSVLHKVPRGFIEKGIIPQEEADEYYYCRFTEKCVRKFSCINPEDLRLPFFTSN